MIRSYALTDISFTPTVYDPEKKSIYISNELYIALYRASLPKLHEANEVFTKAVGTEDYQLVCLVGDNSDQSVSDFELRDIVIEVPVSKVYKLD